MNREFQRSRGAWKAAVRTPLPGTRERQSRRLDQALLETFPASDPVSVAQVN